VVDITLSTLAQGEVTITEKYLLFSQIVRKATRMHELEPPMLHNRSNSNIGVRLCGT
jgi:hypothetical protein